MVGLGAILFTCMLVQAPQVKYDPSLHLAFIEKRMAVVAATRNDLQAAKLPLRDAVRRLGGMLGQSRKLQNQLTGYASGSSSSAGKSLRLIQVAGLFDAYLSSSILELDGDADSGDLAKSLEKRLKQRITAVKE